VNHVNHVLPSNGAAARLQMHVAPRREERDASAVSDCNGSWESGSVMEIVAVRVLIALLGGMERMVVVDLGRMGMVVLGRMGMAWRVKKRLPKFEMSFNR
jgi:hypothetical protein